MSHEIKFLLHYIDIDKALLCGLANNDINPEGGVMDVNDTLIFI